MVLALATTLVLAGAPGALAQPETRGPLSFTTWDAGSITLDAANIRVLVYYPTGATAPMPVVAVVHGSSRTGANMAEMARTLASRGFVALVPNMPCNFVACDHAANARQIRALLDWGVARSAEAASPIAGLVDGERRGVIGHSYGGLAVFLAAQGHPEIDAVVVLDGQDDTGVAAAAAPTLTQPTAHVLAEDVGACNGSNWKDTVYPLTPAPHMRVVVTGSAHCDAEEPGDAICPTVCGRGDASLSVYFRRYTVAWMSCALQADASVADWIGGTELDLDQAASHVSLVATGGLDALPCRSGMPLPDAGTVDVDAGGARPDAGALVDAGAPADAGGVGPDAGADAGSTTTGDAASSAGTDGGVTDAGRLVEPTSGGCGCAAAGRRDRAASLTVLALLALVARRRPRAAALG